VIAHLKTVNDLEVISRLSEMGGSRSEISLLTGNYSDDVISRAIAHIDKSRGIEREFYYLRKLVRAWEGDGKKFEERKLQVENLENIEIERLQKEREDQSRTLIRGAKKSDVKNFIKKGLEDNNLIPLPQLMKDKIRDELNKKSWIHSGRVLLALRLLLKSTGNVILSD
jgi:hypothetical protein